MPQGRGRLHGLSCPDPDLQQALDAEEHSMQQRGTGHSDNAVKLLQLSPTPSPHRDTHAFSLATLLNLGSPHAHLPPVPTPPTSTPPHPTHTPQPPQPAAPGSPLRSSAVGRLLDQITVPPTSEETLVRALCDRLVEYVSYQHALSELSGITEELETFQAEVFLSTFQAASAMHAPRSSSLPASRHARPDQLPPLPSPSSSSAVPHALARTRSLPDRRPGGALLTLPQIPHPTLQPRTSDHTQPRSAAQRPAPLRPPRPDRTLPPLLRQASCPDSPLSAGPPTNHLDPEHTGHRGYLNSHASSPDQQPKPLEDRLPPPFDALSSPSCSSPPQQQAQPLQHSPSPLPRWSRRPYRCPSARTSPSPASSPARPQQFVSLTAYMMHALGKQQQQQQRVCSAKEWGSGSGSSGGRGGGRRASSAFCQAVQERISCMSRQQMDTIRAESRSSVKSAAPLMEPGPTA